MPDIPSIGSLARPKNSAEEMKRRKQFEARSGTKCCPSIVAGGDGEEVNVQTKKKERRKTRESTEIYHEIIYSVTALSSTVAAAVVPLSLLLAAAAAGCKISCGENYSAPTKIIRNHYHSSRRCGRIHRDRVTFARALSPALRRRGRAPSSRQQRPAHGNRSNAAIFS